MNFETTGSPILARQNPALYKFIVLSLIIVVFFLLVAYIAKRISKWMSSDEYLEAKKSMPTTKKNVSTIARKAMLTPEETKLLWHICKTHQAPNIIYASRDPITLKGLFSTHYELMKANAESETRKEKFFTLYYKISTMQNNNKKLKSTSGLREGQECIFKDSRGQEWTFTVIKNTSSFIELEIARSLFILGSRPAPLSKIQISARITADEVYSFLTRVIRYEEKPDGAYTISISPANVVKQIRKRQHRRIATETRCRIAKIIPAVKKSPADPGYVQDGEDFEGVLLDLSAAGCSFATFMEIPSGKYVKATFQFNGKDFKALGLIAGQSEILYRMPYRHHVKFTSISTESKNAIQEYALGFCTNTDVFPLRAR
ncbi:MAG: PilZ domain-containing protein [Treponema sp.]|nr:PilZ domain-containing protein [Treponema sp.]